MILKSLLINNYGPFAFPTKILFDENVTVLTGQNDTGKSSVLRLLRMIADGTSLQEDDVNVNHIYEANSPWDDDDNIHCIATYIVTDRYVKYFKSSIKDFGAGWEVDIKFYLAPKKRRVEVVEVRHKQKGRTASSDVRVREIPGVLFLPTQTEIGSVVDIITHDKNGLEGDLMTLAFGENYSAKLESLSDPNLTRETRVAAERLTKMARDIFPPSMKLEFVFDRIPKGEKEGHKFLINIRDGNGSDTALHLRGSGVKKIITLMVAILNKAPKADPLMILLDEPENSLHANSQHMLRTFFEELAANKNLQMVYVTHSASMINIMQPHRIRLFERVSKDSKSTTIVHNQPIEDNFYPIRSSLGISPADSLLYAPITIVVEGATEVLGLPLLLNRLYTEKIQGYELVNRLLSFSHILDGHGASFEYWCRIAKAQGCKPIIFVDGDRIRQVRQQRVFEEHPDVPIIILENMSEFEEIIPQEAYFRALSEIAGSNNITLVSFSEWEQTATLPSRIAFTKRIDRWLQETAPDFIYDKPDVMKKAIELINLDDVKLEQIKQLVDKMTSILNDNPI